MEVSLAWESGHSGISTLVYDLSRVIDEVYSTRCGFPPIEQALCPISQLLVPSPRGRAKRGPWALEGEKLVSSTNELPQSMSSSKWSALDTWFKKQC